MNHWWRGNFNDKVRWSICNTKFAWDSETVSCWQRATGLIQHNDLHSQLGLDMYLCNSDSNKVVVIEVLTCSHQSCDCYFEMFCSKFWAAIVIKLVSFYLSINLKLSWIVFSPCSFKIISNVFLFDCFTKFCLLPLEKTCQHGCNSKEFLEFLF